MNPKILRLMLLITVTILILVIADVVNAGQIFMPLVTKKANGQAPNPSGVLYVFSTTSTTNGNPGGRSAMSAICTAADPQSHFCTNPEIDEALATTGAYFSNPFQRSWMDNTPDEWGTGYTCSGWTTASPSMRGRTLEDQAKQPNFEICSVVLPVACCKWIP